MHFTRTELAMIHDALAELIHQHERDLYEFQDPPPDILEQEEEYIEDLRELKGKVNDLI